ncbi:unnamed protein product [Paramecium primaurelia]|uniref:Uncharacterized protein n=1 Tax=Paramecium primaurelia TaxID=5886 RepID=A0A8S1JRJ9_PARPR|nr:unnamed protein product [Paramecium primaurelia]
MQQVSLIDKQRRSKERYVYEANNLVQQWRDLFENGYRDYAGNFIKPSLKEAANLVGCSKKTLEDYYSIIRKASQIINIKDCLNMKMGYLRQLLKKDTIFNIAAPEIIQQEQNTQQNDSWNNMIIEADDEVSKTSIDIDQFINTDQTNQHNYENDFTSITFNSEWKEKQLDDEINPAQPYQEWNFYDF